MSKSYTADSIEVLSGLDPVRKRPGMYTDTTRPNHLAQEVIDNSVDEAMAGHASTIKVTLFKDGSLMVEDDGRGMPVDKHPKLKLPGVEVILTTLHAGGKFSNKNYEFSGGLHGVGVSVVNALSTKLEVNIKRDGKVYQMEFADGNKASKLKSVGTCGKKNTGTSIRFWPDAKYFDSSRFAIGKLIHLLRAKAVLCSGLTIEFYQEASDETQSWYYEDGLVDYLKLSTQGWPTLPQEPIAGAFKGEVEQVDWAVQWLEEGSDALMESYVNLIPTIQGGTHVNGLKQGVLDAFRAYCEHRQLLPRGVKLTAEDIWQQCAFVLSFKMQDPHFAGQTKERLSSRQAASFISGVIKDAFEHWLNQHTKEGDLLSEKFISNAQKRVRASKKVVRKKVTQGPALPGKLADCATAETERAELFLVEGDSAGGSAKQARDRDCQAVMPLRGKILNTWEVNPEEVLASQEVHDISVAIGLEPGSSDLSKLRYHKVCVLADADSDGAHIATLLCALFLKHFKPLVEAGHVYIAMPPLFRIDCGKEVYYALDEEERLAVLDRLKAEKKTAKIQITRFKGLGEMNPLQLRETSMAIETRRLVQLVLDDEAHIVETMDMMLAKKRAQDRKRWLEDKGDLADFG